LNANSTTTTIAGTTTNISSTTANISSTTANISSTTTNISSTTTNIGSNILNLGTQVTSTTIVNPAVATSFIANYKNYCMPNFVAGVYLINSIALTQHISLPIFYSCKNLGNVFGIPSETFTRQLDTEAAAGSYNSLGVADSDNRYLVYPGYGLVVYNDTDYSGTVRVNYKNTSIYPVAILTTNNETGSSIRVYFNNLELTGPTSLL
jgi:hypothetical protein